ncbi:alanine racemase [Paracoccus alcaliphilus]|uniref:Alanine racemase n=1 Tax=Paracoccus alcaliphilus TaxID=34002 RepID=A0A1H8KXL4_9RHOB|nr:alanine racemase [Paracoccus alcaliphilus]WCR17633.1 alanine racemase [Paracoccus alcaliphilus]SEN97148.1 alanine racemase [Paracoccus alcaliphilus]
MGLQIDIGAIVANWKALAAKAPGARAAAVVKADGYGLGAAHVAPALYEAGARDFFVALAQEGRAIRPLLPDDARINVLSGHMAGEDLTGLVPVLNSPEQFFRDRTTRPGQPFAIQLDSGMNRLGMEPAEWAGLRDEAIAARPDFIMSHLACADEPDHPANAAQLTAFRQMTEGCDVPLSLAATGGILLGPDYHFDLVRPGVGLYGGMPFADARQVVRLSLPVIQTRSVQPGELVGYGATWYAGAATRVATVAAGYADGVLRALSSSGASLYAGGVACPIVGRVSMDLITADVSALSQVPEALDLICDEQPIDAVAYFAGTIGYEILTSLGNRYPRTWL